MIVCTVEEPLERINGSGPEVVRIRLPSLEWIEEQQGEMICHSFLRMSLKTFFIMLLFLSFLHLLNDALPFSYHYSCSMRFDCL